MRSRLILLVLLAAAALLVPATAASAAPVPPPRALPTALEPMADYVGQAACDPVARPGINKLVSLLTHTYAGTTAHTVYACGTDGGQSEHYDGRAIDWMVSIRNATQYADAHAFLVWLFATDARGNRFAMMRRLGIMYVIYNNRILGSWDSKWQPYGNCLDEPSTAYDAACHRDHMHLSLSWNGATGRTTYWGYSVYPEDFGPCRPSDLNWAGRYTAQNRRPCPTYKTVSAAAGSSALKQQLVRYSGAAYQYGWTGPGVTAVQRALHVTASGRFDAATKSAVLAFQKRVGVAQTGTMSPATWRALLPRIR